MHVNTSIVDLRDNLKNFPCLQGCNFLSESIQWACIKLLLKSFWHPIHPQICSFRSLSFEAQLTSAHGPHSFFLLCVCVFACFLLNPYDRISVLSIHLTQNYIIISTVIVNNYIYTHIYIQYIYIILLYYYSILHHLNSNTSISSAFLLPPAVRWRGWPQRPGRESPRAVGSPSAPPSPAESVNVL